MHIFRRHQDYLKSRELHLCEQCGDTYYTETCLNTHRKPQISRKISKKYEEQWMKTLKIQGLTGLEYDSSCNMYTCSQCKKKFSGKHNFMQHVNAVHLGKRPWACEVCKIGFTTKNVMKEHMLNKHPEHLKEEEKELHLCEICGYTYHTRTSLRSHIYYVHDEMRTSLSSHSNIYVCCHCNKGFRVKFVLIDHINAVHFLKQKCNICSKTFTSKQGLKFHKDIHSDEPKYKCEICFGLFKRKDYFFKHQKKCKNFKSKTDSA